jgi:hypothetical protein
MDAIAYIQKGRAAGFSLACDGDRLLVSPIENLTDAERRLLAAHKLEIIAALRASDTLIDADGGHDLLAANEIAPLPARLVTAATRVCREVHGDSAEAIAAILDDLRTQPDDWDALTEHCEQQLPPPPQPGHERRRMQAAGYQFDIDVPTRTSVQFELRDGQGGGVFAGAGLTVEQRRHKIMNIYGDRLAVLDGQAVVTCRRCRHGSIGLRPPVATCDLGLQSDNPTGQWLADDLHACGGYEDKP